MNALPTAARAGLRLRGPANDLRDVPATAHGRTLRRPARAQAATLRFSAALATIASLLAFSARPAPADEVASAPSTARPRLPDIRIKLADGPDQPPYTGRVFLIFTQDESREPRHLVGWFSREPIVAFDVKDRKIGEELSLADQKPIEFALEAGGLPAGAWRVQAVIDRNGATHEVLNAAGNGYSKPAALDWSDAGAKPLELTIDQTIPRRTPASSDTRKHFRLESRLLSAFHGKKVEQVANVFLPKDYEKSPDRRYPTVYVINGFGDSETSGLGGGYQRMLASVDMTAVVVHIVADCATGHHVFADSANNGPVGTALVEELIPALEREFRLIPESSARYVTGHSSGGWSSLWLQVAYPDTFGGCWSTAPDPVDFSAFQTVDIYAAGANMFTDAEGKPRPISRPGRRGKSLLSRQFCELEEVLGRGGQLQSFEAVFSPRSESGKPLQLWDRAGGAIDPAVAKAWRKYDIADLLRRDWDKLGPKLRGKIHIWCGDEDSFYLEEAVRRLQKTVADLGSDAKITMLPETTHNFSPAQMTEVARSMAEHEKQLRPGG